LKIGLWSIEDRPIWDSLYIMVIMVMIKVITKTICDLQHN